MLLRPETFGMNGLTNGTVRLIDFANKDDASERPRPIEASKGMAHI